MNIDNSKTAEESAVRIHNPIFYVPDPEEEGPIEFFQAYFGIVGRDPELEENRKIPYALQEDGSAVPMEQPLTGSAGGVPVYNGSPISLAVNGSYSLKILDKDGVQKYYFPHVDAVNMQGFSGVIAEESKTVAGSLSINFDKIEATTASFYQSTASDGASFKGELLKKDIDYVVNNPSRMVLLNPTADGVVILGRQMDPTGQIVPVTDGASALFVFEDIAKAKESNLQPGDTVTINGGVASGDRLGGNRYETVLGQPESDDGENNINLDNGNQLKAIENSFVLARYSEATNTVSSVAGSLNLDLSKGNVFKATLTENISSINITNLNPDSSLTTTVTLKITQGSTSAYTVSFTGFSFPNGETPTMSESLGARDRYIFIKDDSGWDASVAGQNYS